jgi:hypothetical protein
VRAYLLDPQLLGSWRIQTCVYICRSVHKLILQNKTNTTADSTLSDIAGYCIGSVMAVVAVVQVHVSTRRAYYEMTRHVARAKSAPQAQGCHDQLGRGGMMNM